MKNERKAEIWERIRGELKRLRGMNKFRGTETHIFPKGIIRIPEENRKGELKTGEVVIHLTEIESELWAEHIPSGEKFFLREYAHDLAAFMTALVDRCRGNTYLRTQSKSADYRKMKKPDTSKVAGNEG